MKVIFVSSPKHLALQLWEKSTCLAKFEPADNFGLFITEDKRIIEKLKKHPLFNKTFKIWKGSGMPHFNRVNINHGVVSSLNNIDKNIYIKYGELKAKLLDKDGNYKKDASEDEIKEFEEIKGLVE